MNKEQMIIAIAESVGAKWLGVPTSSVGMNKYRPSMVLTFLKYKDIHARMFVPPICSNEGDKVAGHDIPDYTGDLNAICEMCEIQLVNTPLWDTFISHLRSICGDPVTQTYSLHRAYNATALQRAEAYLRTIGKWIEPTN